MCVVVCPSVNVLLSSDVLFFPVVFYYQLHKVSLSSPVMVLDYVK